MTAPATTPKCYGWDGERFVYRRHQDTCVGGGPYWVPGLVWTDCDGCEPCTEPHCAVCGREHLDDDHPQTCVGCLDKARTDLSQIMQLAALAEDRLDDWWPPVSPGLSASGGRGEPPLPGGDLLVLTGPGARGDADPVHNPDDRRDDPTSVVGELAGWEDWWRRVQHQAPSARDAVLSRVLGYLTLHLTWAAQHEQQFPAFASAVRRLRTRLELELKDGAAQMRGVACFDCGATLIRPSRDRAAPCRHVLEAERAGETPARWIYTLSTYAGELGPEHATCDQGGTADQWSCPRCRRVYTDREYWFAVRAAVSAEAEEAS